MSRLSWRVWLAQEDGLAVLEYALLLVAVILPVAVIMLAAYNQLISQDFVGQLIDRFLFRLPHHLVGAFTYF